MKWKWFKKDDPCFDRISKIISIAGVVFGIWAYCSTIHPVFTKEKELLDAKNEIESLKQEIADKNKILEKVQARLVDKNKDLEEVQAHLENLKKQKSELKAKNEELNELNQELEYQSIKAKLYIMIYEVIDKYELIKIKNEKEKPDLKSVALEIAKLAKEKADNPIDKKAVDYFENYIKKKVPDKYKKYDLLFDVTVDFLSEYKRK